MNELKHIQEDDIFKPAPKEEVSKRKQRINMIIAKRIAAAISVHAAGPLKDAATGVMFDDANMSPLEEESHDVAFPAFWTQVCKGCVTRRRFPEEMLESGASGMCGVLGCDFESDFYYEFDTAETKLMEAKNIFKPAPQKELEKRPGYRSWALPIYFADYIMQRQYEDLVHDGMTKDLAAEKVRRAHAEYLGEAEIFKAVPEDELMKRKEKNIPNILASVTQLISKLHEIIGPRPGEEDAIVSLEHYENIIAELRTALEANDRDMIIESMILLWRYAENFQLVTNESDLKDATRELQNMLPLTPEEIGELGSALYNLGI